jgi:hypothetical protein
LGNVDVDGLRSQHNTIKIAGFKAQHIRAAAFPGPAGKGHARFRVRIILIADGHRIPLPTIHLPLHGVRSDGNFINHSFERLRAGDRHIVLWPPHIGCVLSSLGPCLHWEPEKDRQASNETKKLLSVTGGGHDNTKGKD